MRDGVEIVLIVAMSSGRVIGVGGDLPWHISEDLQFFKAKTLGHAVIMGRRTFESMGGSLSDRHNIVVSRSGFAAEGVEVYDSLEGALDYAIGLDCGEVFVIGGGEIFALALDIADRIYVTEVDLDIVGDVYFPEFDIGDWDLVKGQWLESVDKRTGNSVRYRFLEYAHKVFS